MLPPHVELCASSDRPQATGFGKSDLSTSCLAPGGCRGESAPLMSGFGPKLRWLRAAAEQTQRQFANGVGVSDRSLSIWEKGTRPPSKSNVKLLARYVGVPVDELAAFLDGQAKLTTLPKQMRRWVEPPITERLSKKTLAELRMLLDEAEGTN